MLQQTQTERVLPKYLAWFERFPDARSVAEASLPDILGLWSGLGYNRRALALSRAAGIVAGGGFPETEAALLALPGVGRYTARAVLCFAFGHPSVFVETNIRSVFIHHFFPGESAVPDRRVEALVAATLDRGDARRWYYALMDYGAHLKKIVANPNRRSAHYAKQTPFADSNRRVRGAILRELTSRSLAGNGRAGAGSGHSGESAVPLTMDELAGLIPFSRERVAAALSELVREGFVVFEVDRVSLPPHSAVVNRERDAGSED